MTPRKADLFLSPLTKEGKERQNAEVTNLPTQMQPPETTMDAKQRRMRRRNDERKLKKENAGLIEKYARDGISYCFEKGRVKKVEVEILANSPPPEKRNPVVIDDPMFKKRPEEMFHVSDELFSELVQKWVSIIEIMKSREEVKND